MKTLLSFAIMFCKIKILLPLAIMFLVFGAATYDKWSYRAMFKRGEKREKELSQ